MNPLAFVYTLITHGVLTPGKPTWSADHLPDLSSKVIVVTGGNAGIGLETVKRLLLKNAKVYIATRSQEKSERAIEALRAETGKTAHFLKLDLSDLGSVKKAVEEFKQCVKCLHDISSYCDSRTLILDTSRSWIL